MDSRDSKLKNPDNSHSDLCSKPGIEDMNKNFEVLQDQETPPRATQHSDRKTHALSPDDASSSAAEANNKSVTTSENPIREMSETHETKAIIVKQPKEDNHPSPAKRRVYRGLRNQGATCYLNAVLQTLFMTKDFRDVIIELKSKKRKNKSLSFKLQNLFKDLESNTESPSRVQYCVTTHEVTKALEIENVREQQDAAEYYQKILSMLEPKAAKIFQGQKKHSTTCKHGNHDPIEEFISFFSVAIAMDSGQDKINVQESFDAQFKEMLMDGEDQLFCETCKRMMDMKMSCTISELPDVLTLHLQRFYLDYCYMIYMKNNCPVEIPLQLKVQDHHIYELYALVNHTGSLSGGHYYTDIKSFDDQQWYEFNDSTVQMITKTYDVRHIISNMACLLFFKKLRTEQDLKPALNTTETADLDHQPSSDASSSAAEANNKSVITSENPPQQIVVSETHGTKPIIDKLTNHTSPAERREITRSTIPRPKDGHKKSLKGECKTPHNDRTSVQICINRKDIVNLPTDSDPATEANLEKQIMNPEPPKTAHNESDLDNDEARAQCNSFLQETTVSRRKYSTL